jgi:lysophospholipase L1-like esterase
VSARRRAADAGIVLAAMLAALPLAEVVLRVAAPRRLPSQEQIRGFVLKGMYIADERAGYRPAPNFSGRIERRGYVTEFSTDSLGLRGDELGPKDRPRVLALGDSFTWGWGVPQGEEWIRWAGKEIEQRGGPAVETVNGGVNGYGTDNALARLEDLGPAIAPDLVLLGFFANDYTDNVLGARDIYTVREGYLFDLFSHRYLQENALARESHLYRLLTTAWETFRVRRLGGVPSARPVKNFTEAEFRRGMELSEQYILRMREVAGSLGARFAVVWLPADVYALDRQRAEDIPLQWELQQRILAAGIPSLDLFQVVAAEARVDALYLADDGHLSLRGNRVVGRAVGRWIVEQGLLGSGAP